MDIQTVFYALGSVFIFLNICVLIGLGVLIWKAYKAVQQTQMKIEGIMNHLPEKVVEFVTSRPTLIASSIGMGLSNLVMKKAKSFFHKK